MHLTELPSVTLQLNHWGMYIYHIVPLYWGNKEWLPVHYGEFEEARGWVILNNARAERVHYSESPTRVPLQIPIMHR